MKKKLVGYVVKNYRGDVIEELVGTQPRRALNKFRKTMIVRKVFANRRGVVTA